MLRWCTTGEILHHSERLWQESRYDPPIILANLKVRADPRIALP